MISRRAFDVPVATGKRGFRVQIRSHTGRWAAALLGLALTTLLLGGCSKTKSEPKEQNAAGRRVLLRNLGEQVFLPSLTRFTAEATSLSKASTAYAGSLSEEDRSAVQNAWQAAMAAWERVEVLLVGPARNVGSAPGGLGLRQEIYSWPDTNACGIDRVLVDKSYGDSAALLEATYPSVRGLATLERLLFQTSTESACPATNSIITSGDWATLVEGELAQRRADYASALAKLVLSNAKKLEGAWKSDFLEQLATAGDGSKLFKTTQDALNAVSDGLFYLDTETKDMKLANPLGITMICTEKRCPAQVEHVLAKVSKESIIENLEAFRDVYRGLPPGGTRGAQMWGFKDLLLSISADDVAADMDKLLDKALSETQAIEGTLEEALAANDAQAKQADKAYIAVQDLCDRLKTDFIAKLALKLPMSAAGDND